MSEREFVLGSDIYQCHIAFAHPRRAEVGDDPLNAGAVAFADGTQRLHQGDDILLARKTVKDALALPFSIDQLWPPQDLQVPRRVGESHAREAARSSTERFPCPRCFKQRELVGVRKLLGDVRQVFENCAPRRCG